MPDFLQNYLDEVPQGLDSLLSLIPAKNYYVEDAGDTWKRPKQTKAEAAAARKAKLDPDSKRNRNVKEQWEEEQKSKRKAAELDEDADADEGNDSRPDVEAIEGIELEKPGEGLKRKAEKAEKAAKKQKTNGDAEEAKPEESSKLSKKAQKQEAKREARKVKKEAQKAQKAAKKSKSKDKPDDEQWETDDEADAPAPDDTTKAVSEIEVDAEVSSPESEPPSPTFDNAEQTANVDSAADPTSSTTTSVSSTVAPSEKPKHIKVPSDTEALRARLAAKIEALRAARKADGPDGKPIRTRQELIEMRRKKQAQRKEHKQELRKQAKLAAEKEREEALASNSPSVMSPAVELDEGGFSFGRVAFGDGAQLSHDLSYVLNQGKKKGPSDPKTALLKVQNQKKRLEELDESKRKDIEDKEAWLTARRRATGEKIHDDEAMLKRAVKRKEAGKKKSEKAWSERSQGVQRAQKDRQKKREENLRKRREEKNAPKGKKKKKAAAAAAGGKKKGRPGFEGVGFGGRKK